MAITMAGTAAYLWQGLSSDTKPTDIRVSVNDVFLETDTGKYWVYNGTAWFASASRPPLRAA